MAARVPVMASFDEQIWFALLPTWLHLERLQLVGVLRDFFLIPVAAACPFFDVFELFALRSFGCEVIFEARTTRHCTPAAVAKQRYSTNPQRIPT